MIKIILSFILFLSIEAKAQLTVDNDPVIVVHETSVGPNPPAVETETKIVVEEEITEAPEIKADHGLNLYVDRHIHGGNIYFGGEPVPVEFLNYAAGIYYLSESKFSYGLEYNFLTNEESVKITGVSFKLGYQSKVSEIISLYGDFGVGGTNYEEVSKLQNMSVTGPSVAASVGALWNFYGGFDLNVSYKYFHAMYTRNFSYYGSNPRDEVAFDLHGLGVGLRWGF